MKKTENNVRTEINSRIYEQVGGEKGLSVAFNKLREERGWKTPQPLYNVKNGEANLTTTTLHDIGSIDKSFSADVAIFGEYRLPSHLQELQEKCNAMAVEIQKEREERKRAEIRAERAEGSNEVLQAALKEAMIQNGVNFHTGDTNGQLADNILMIALYTDILNKSVFLE